jgi:hypothetical protein
MRRQKTLVEPVSDFREGSSWRRSKNSAASRVGVSIVLSVCVLYGRWDTLIRTRFSLNLIHIRLLRDFHYARSKRVAFGALSLTDSIPLSLATAEGYI